MSVSHKCLCKAWDGSGLANQDEIFKISRGRVPACLAKVMALSIGFRVMSVNNKCPRKAVGCKWVD